MDDPRNTDDAWVMSEASYVLDKDYFFSNYPLMDSISSLSLLTSDCSLKTDPLVMEVTWAVVHSNLEMFVDHMMLLREAVRQLRQRYRSIFFE
jgi:hypothetical protein